MEICQFEEEAPRSNGPTVKGQSGSSPGSRCRFRAAEASSTRSHRVKLNLLELCNDPDAERGRPEIVSPSENGAESCFKARCRRKAPCLDQPNVPYLAPALIVAPNCCGGTRHEGRFETLKKCEFDLSAPLMRA